MSASDHLQPAQFYHGTPAALSPGDLVEPGHPSTKGAGRADRGSHVYAATTPEIAGGHGNNVYQVEPTGPMELDPELVSAFGGVPSRPELHTHWRSKHPLRILGKQ